MSTRKNPRRSSRPAAFSFRHFGDISDSDEEALSNLMLSNRANKGAHLKCSAVPKKTKKQPQRKQNSSRGRGNSSFSMIEQSEKTELKDDIDVDNMRKKIGHKIDTIFKDSNLISDEDDVDIVEEKVDPPQIMSKHFYVLTDSDDEEPLIVSNSDNTTKAATAAEVPSISSKPLSDSNKDELMDIVDQILDVDDMPAEVNIETDKSWTEYKKKTEEVLNSVSTLLDSIQGEEKGKQNSACKRDKSPENKPSCPICLETFGDTVKAATTLCGHIFCYSCINEVARTTKRCPTCRKVVNAKKFHAVYF